MFRPLARWLRRALDRMTGPRLPRAGPPARQLPERRQSRRNGARQLLHLFEHSASGLLTCDAQGRIVLCSPVAARLLGTEPGTLCGQPLAGWLDPLAASGADAARLFEPGQCETMAHRANGSSFPVELTVSHTRLDGVPQSILILRDITDRRLTQEQLSYLANFDSLTGLPNRTLFRDRLAQAMARARRSRKPMALMLLDLDKFKLINDSLGHEVGDQVLRQVAEMLKGCLRGGDSLARGGGEAPFTVSRLGGDEFTVIAEQLASPEDAALIARRIIEALERPIHLLDHERHVSTSIGISMYPADDTDLDGLIRHTDMAMYRAKAMGRGTYSFFSAELSAELAARLQLENELRQAVERQEFVLHYQPKANLRSGEVVGVEALIRWQPPGRGLVPPDRFISALEDSGMILPVGAWAIRTACAELAAWDRAGLPPLTLAVNLSARQFGQPFLAGFIRDALAEAGISPQRLELELTERLLMEDSGATRGVLGALAAMGVRVAMDDFGTGYSSLSYLKRFDIDTLKIDRSFVSELASDPEDQAIATAIVAMGHSLNMKIVAEGVETEAQAQFLEALGCDEIQGYLLSRPMASAAFVEWMRARQAAERTYGAAPDSDSHPMTLMTMQTLDG
ncbi:MAG: EAL domain-containing protein [Burkholderiales bacterium]|nr:EAL domain-containing protein [Burkholderiales bacterium]